MAMKKEKQLLVGYYNEAMIQLGFIVFFAPVFPLAPLFSFLTNLLEIFIKMNALSEVSRRFVAEGANGIGSWINIMEFMSFISIPINIAIIYFAADGPGTESTIVKKLAEENWSDKTIVLAIVGLEHIVLIMKAFLSVVIPDVPETVISAEFKREKTNELAALGLL